MKSSTASRRGVLSVLNCLNATSLKLLKEALHCFERFRGVPQPIRDLARDP
jgi:hypothetical protein